MATFSQVFGTLIFGSIVTGSSLLAFHAAVKFEWNSNLTPRAWSRPKQVIKNCLTAPFYGVSWITWALKQTYIDLLAGIPGTGTRKNGWSGPALKANLDAVIQIRFHTLQFKVSVVATFLMMVLLLPLYYTAKCDPILLGLQSCLNLMNLTDFEQLTVTNVPAYSFSSILNGTTAVIVNSTTTLIIEARTKPNTGNIWSPGLTGRYVAPVLVVAIISFYACYLLWHEWIECLALRRVYYLEADYYQERIEELDDLRSNKHAEDPFQKVRPPYLPHPEMRETIPNVSLNSVLYQLPNHLKASFGKKDRNNSLLERQLEATVNFFDQCVPNQPGYTSSVAAVTIVPEAKWVKDAWMKWYICGKRLRRLRYIKHLIETRRRMEEDGVRSFHDYVDTAKHMPGKIVKATGKVTNKVTSKAIDTATTACTHISDHISGKDSRSLNSNKSDKEFHDVENAINEDDTQDPDVKNDGNGTERMEQKPSEELNLTEPKDDTNHQTRDGNVKASEQKPSKGWIGNFTNMLGINQESSHTDEKETSESFEVSKEEIDGMDPEVGKISRTRDSKSENAAKTEESTEVGVTFGSAVFHDARSERKSRTLPSGSALGISTIAEDDNENHGLPSSLSSPRKSFKYEDFDPEEFAKWIGFPEETECDEIVDSLGIEQLSVYSREMSQSASNPCVYGCSPDLLKFSSIEELEDMVDDAWTAVREANAELLRARAEIYRKESCLPKDEAQGDDNGDEELEYEDDMSKSSQPSEKPENDSFDDHVLSTEDGTRPSFSDTTGLRQRTVPSARAKYNMAQSLVKQMQNISSSTTAIKKSAKTGCCRGLRFGFVAKKSARQAAKLLDHPSYAVVTFTSRQAAIAARQCLADGKSVDRWNQVGSIPVAPLADAPPRNLLFFRGCCRPVTLTLNNKEKKGRKFLVWTFYFFFCCLYTLPLALTSAVLNPEYLANAFPDATVFQNSNTFFYRFFAGISSGMLYSLFFSVLPQIFKYIAFMMGTASSVPRGEDNALRLYWYFMLVTAFTGSTLAQMLIDSFLSRDITVEFKTGLLYIASTIPTSQAPVWLNWMLTRTFITLPMNYLFQFMTFLYGWLRIKWLNRVMRGGGPGGPPPYRINVDSGVVFMCITSLAPVCPIIAPFATLYYMLFIPMLRWLHVFVYRPKYDAGGSRFPIYHEIIISSLMLGQILTAAVFLLKQAFTAGVLIAVMTIPTFFFSMWTKEQFERSYMDAGLLQTSQLDGWEHNTTLQDREKYRKWLVDCHKASYVPICMSGGEDFLTSQPSVTVPTHRDMDNEMKDEDEDEAIQNKAKSPSPPRGLELWKEASTRLLHNTSQKGAVFKRYMDS